MNTSNTTNITNLVSPARIDSPSDFPLGYFHPHATASGTYQRLLAQTKFESTLLWRNLEQLLLTMLVPVTLLILTISINIGRYQNPANIYVPIIVGFTVISIGFTGQAIAIGFDRRYGALYRLGASPLPRWCIVTGKCLAVCIAVIFQAILESVIGAFLGYRPHIINIAFMIFFICMGTISFTALGLLLGGTLKAEIILGLANLLWFIFAGICACVLYNHSTYWLNHLLRFTPPGALSHAMIMCSQGRMDWSALIVLGLWSCGAIVFAKKYFSFS